MTPDAATLPGAAGQVARLLRLVPLLHERHGVRVSEAATLLGVSERQVVRDLKVLFFCGLPGGYPDDLIDVDLDSLEGPRADGVIRVSNADYLARPLRLTPAEAGALVLALRALGGTSDEATREVVERTVTKLAAAASGALAPVAVRPDEVGVRSELEVALRRAVRDDHQVRLHYWVPSRDELAWRTVDPVAVEVEQAGTYLRGWCHTSADARSFRLDRVLDWQVTDVAREHRTLPAEPGREVGASGTAAPLQVRVRLAPPAQWVLEYHRFTDVVTLPDGTVEATLVAWEQAWVERLLLRLAPDAVVLDPPDLAQRHLDLASAALGLYPGA